MGEREITNPVAESSSVAQADEVFVAPGWAPTTEPRSWAELAETLQGGVAVLDREWRVTWASDRFLPVLGPPSAIVGRDLRLLLPALRADDPRSLGLQVDRGTAVEFVQQAWAHDDERLWFRVTIHPTQALGHDVSAVVFSMDTTHDSSALALLREATLSLTEIEDELNRRIARIVHDGPIQLLAALVLRLDMIDAEEDTSQLRHLATTASTQLRAAVAQFSHREGRLPPDQLLQTWIDPFLDMSRIRVEIEDHRTSPVDDATTQEIFVFVYAVVRVALQEDRDRLISVLLTDDNDGDRIDLRIPHSTGNVIHIGHVAARFRALETYTKSLGGTISTSMDRDVVEDPPYPSNTGGEPLDVRTLSVWLPSNSGSEIADDWLEQRRRSSEADPPSGADDLRSIPPLTNAAWEELVGAMPETFIEVDPANRYSYVNAASVDTFGADSDIMIGVPLEDLFTPEALASLEPAFERLDLGEVVEAEWRREKVFSDTRIVRWRASPRIDDDGRWLGVACTINDLTNVELLEQLVENALADLALSRTLATRNSMSLLDDPLRSATRLIGLLRSTDPSTPGWPALQAIGVELEMALPRIRASLDVTTAPDLAATGFGEGLRASLGSVLDGSRLEFSDEGDVEMSGEDSEILFRIAREAVINGVTHGRADHVSIRLRSVRDGIALDIHDNGVGIRPGDLDHRRGHLGTRAMRDRALERGGNCRIEPDRRGGTRVSVWLPRSRRRSTLLHAALDRES